MFNVEFGSLMATISIEVDANTREQAIEIAIRQIADLVKCPGDWECNGASED